MSMRPKPSNSQWTDEQWAAISLHHQNLLVAAAAGSGKTAVLVERIIQRISNEQDPVDVDRLLVATFTKAAADEMRQRIREALEKQLQNQSHSQHIRKQLALIHNASITTLHSFCLEVVRRYFQLVELDPGFRIGNETEMELMRQDALEECFEHAYTSKDEADNFWKLVDAYSGDRSDEPLFRLVLKLYDFSRSNPWPELWLQEMADRFKLEEKLQTNNWDNEWSRSMLSSVRLELTGAVQLLQEALHLSRLPDGPAAYIDTLRLDLELVEQLNTISRDGSWSELYNGFRALDFPRLKAVKSEEVNELVKDKVKQLRDQVKKLLLDVKQECFERDPETFMMELQKMAPLMQALIQLVIDFAERYQAMKTAKCLVDFNDLEHYCLRILRDPHSTPDEILPSPAALAYQEQFVEVLLDEYQDTNLVQESILKLISRQSPGNRFMVGDVKQSIYRFRLAEPALFLQKYKAYAQQAGETAARTAGRRIDLARNFRSRSEVVDGVNYIFKQMMQESVGEIAYDEQAALIYGAAYPPRQDEAPNQDCAVEMMLLDRTLSIHDHEQQESLSVDDEAMEEAGLDSPQELETAQLEARCIAAQIKQLMGSSGMPFQVVDKQKGINRAIQYRDIVILLRATQQWAPIMMEELRMAGIPCYAELSTGYFAAGEIEIILSLLRIIDNPLQELPLAAVLRSPMYQLTAEELAQIRITSKGTAFYQAILNAAEAKELENSSLQQKLSSFLVQLDSWRTAARQGSLSELIWRIYQETGYYDLVGGMPGGTQRQANLRALYDRAKQYEETSFRGLFRFLRFIERMIDSGVDLGTARALGEQEDVVRIMSIHKSKGLEFPVVFIAGMGKMFNRQDLHGHFLIHKELGFGPKIVDTQLSVSYPSLANIAIKRRLKLEMLAEEMRVLYVALTRAKEKLFLVATSRNLEKQLQEWGAILQHDEEVLPDHVLARAVSYLDWIGPALIRHPHAASLRQRINENALVESVEDHGDVRIFKGDTSSWRISVIASDGFAQAAAAQAEADPVMQHAVKNAQVIDTALLQSSQLPQSPEIVQRLQWRYPYKPSETIFAKTTVTEMKRSQNMERMQQMIDEAEIVTSTSSASTTAFLPDAAAIHRSLLRRPRFLEEKKMSAAERGTLYHLVMQHIPLQQDMDEACVQQWIKLMVTKQFLTEEQSKHIDPAVIMSFFSSGLGKRLLKANRVWREVPFSYALSAKRVNPHADASTKDETVMIQGVIDCLFAAEDGGDDGLVLLDYKTDAVYGNQIEMIRERYRLQVELYAEAIESIWKQPVVQKVLFLFDGAHFVEV